ncbi:hypothetical protein Cylst_2292 [Cylindrospermum stagnale PCC 7417]|uniref:HEAT repeat domain-containing protein n=1 Tax=Cylindrospermum stagnale PCC 7417 TaxID=56107 RepID=K9WYD6_9NOST|nr:hypothetical protein [Cylindrospermum stagnale]AFZ24522.1 hypothetical protein Cylst_2292 [Cylindrospermum stagnale PCC 7417]
MERLILYDGLKEADILIRSGYLGWRLIGEKSEDDSGLRQFVWKACSDQATIYYTFDPVLKVSFLDFDGDSGEEAIGQAYASFPIYLPDELSEVVFLDDDDVTAMRKMAHISVSAQTNPKPEYREVFASGLAHPSSRVREGTAYAISHANQRIFSDLLREVSEQDPSSDVRSMAKEGLSYLEKEGF